MKITELLEITETTRCTFEGVRYVIYWDGAHEHCIYADDFDTEYPEGSFSTPDGYTEWCGKIDGPDDETAIGVGRHCGIDYLHSLDGTVRRLDCN